MKTKNIKLFLFALFASGGILFFLRLDRVAPIGVQAHAAENPQRKILYWTDPMMPDFRSDHPGKSPMNMDMVPVYEDESTPGTVKLSPKTEQAIGLKTGKVVEKAISRTIKAAGTVTYDERKVAIIQSKVSGWVEKLYLNFTGQNVKKGDYLLEIYSPDLVSSKEEFLLAKNSLDMAREAGRDEMLDNAEKMFEASWKRLEYSDVPEHQIRALEESGKIFKTLHIHSPYDGVVVGKPIVAGMQVTPGVTLYTIADISTVWVLADLYESEIAWVKTGDLVAIKFSAIPGKKFAGTVKYINPFLEKDLRTVKVRIEIQNQSAELKPDMYAMVEIATGTHRGLALPSEAVIRGGKTDIVFVAKGAGAYEAHEVRLGIEGDEYFEALEGVKAGDEVVTSAQFLIDSESRLREAVNKIGYVPLKHDEPRQHEPALKPLKLKVKEKLPANTNHDMKDMDMKDMDMKGME
jgi:Cu(I)/Ag(I) efflux system membrane fusion protein